MTDARLAMNAMYGMTRHVYDATRKYYLLGRDRLIHQLDLTANQSVLEIGCGTARNLIKIGKRYPHTQLYGLDAADAMLDTARASVVRAGLANRTTLAQGYAQDFDPSSLFNRMQFDRIVFSYCLSMIPPWRESIDHALTLLAPGGQIHIVDFGDMQGIVSPARSALKAWLSLFDVHVRPDVRLYVDALPASQTTDLYGGYCWLGLIRR